jgi:hypothetical protein
MREWNDSTMESISYDGNGSCMNESSWIPELFCCSLAFRATYRLYQYFGTVKKLRFWLDNEVRSRDSISPTGRNGRGPKCLSVSLTYARVLDKLFCDLQSDHLLLILPLGVVALFKLRLGIVGIHYQLCRLSSVVNAL